MAEKFRNKFRIESARLRNWDYSSNGLYFITCCTLNHERLFGEIFNKQINYSAIGEIVLEEWEKSFEIRHELFCDAFVIMPNHIHAILRIENFDTINTETHQPMYGVAIRQPKSISSFMAGFKSAVTKQVRDLGLMPEIINKIGVATNTSKTSFWQTRFHDHIIRDEQEYYRIKKYIEKNPERWERDKFFK